MSSEELVTTTSADLPPSEPIDLDDVLDSSFLDSDADSQVLSSTSTEIDSRKHLKSLNRWDVISVGAFRQTLETSGNSEGLSANWTSDSGFLYENMMKADTLDSLMFDNKSDHSHERQPNASRKASVSPALLPVRDANRTPTPLEPPQTPPIHHHTYHKTRKELRREKKMKRKSYGPVNQHQHQHHHHQHHPNMKTRSSSSMQRANFFSSPASSVPSLNL
jgi:hypothetical protein